MTNIQKIEFAFVLFASAFVGGSIAFVIAEIVTR